VKNETIQVKETPVEKDIENKLVEDCDKKNIIPLDDIKEKVLAHEKLIKASDPKLITATTNVTEAIIIDKELPDSEYSRERKELDEKFKEYMRLYKEGLQSTEKKAASFVQMKLLEAYFIEKNYKPFLNFIQMRNKRIEKTSDNSHRSFLQIEKLNELNTEDKSIKKNQMILNMNNLFLGQSESFYDEIRNGNI
jgi:hypothetical protein